MAGGVIVQIKTEARTAESQIHQQAVSGVDILAGIKNSTDGNIKNAIDAVIAVASRHAMMDINNEEQLIIKKSVGNDYAMSSFYKRACSENRG